MEKKKILFTPSFTPLCIWISLFGVLLPLTIIFLLSFLFSPGTISIPLVPLSLGLILALIAAYLLRKHLAISLIDQTLGGHTFWSRKQNISLDQISEIRPYNLIGLKFYRAVTAEHKHPIWIPAFLADKNAFLGTLDKQTGREHPLVSAFSTSGETPEAEGE